MAETQNGAAPTHADHAAVPPPPPDLPLGPRERLVVLLQQLGVGALVCKLRKQVDASDAKPRQSRLQLTYQLARDLLESGDLTDGEKGCIHGQNNVNPGLKPKNSGLKLDGYDRDGTRYEAMRFGRVDSMNGKNGNGLYRLKGFGKFVTATGLKSGHTLVAWVFRLPLPAPAQEEEAAPEPALEEAAPAVLEEAAPAAQEEDAPARLAVVLLNYASMDLEVVEEMVEWEEKALMNFGAVRGLLHLASGHQGDN